MMNGIRQLQATDLRKALVGVLVPRLANLARSRSAGHCMRVFDLDPELSMDLATTLRKETPEALFHILSDSPQSAGDLYVSSTKLVELRNPLPDGTLRPPLCVFLPPNLKTSAEDSFGVATFEDCSFKDVYEDLRDDLLAQLAPALQGTCREILQFLKSEQWRWANSEDAVRYLLSARSNGNDAESFGIALYELGLVPDFRLLDSLGSAYGRIRKNLECVRTLTTSGGTIRSRVLDLDLQSSALRKRLAEFLITHGTEDPRSWTRTIVLDKKNWELTFDKWQFSSRLVADRIRIHQVSTDLPRVTTAETDEKLADLMGQQILAPKERKKLSVTFEVSPHPNQIRGLDHFTIQLLSRNAGPVGINKKVKVWTAKRLTAVVSLTKLDKTEFDEGWHFIRILPWTAEGEPIPMSDSSADALASNESEPFYVLPNTEIQEEPPQRALPRAESLDHARLDRQFSAVVQRRDPLTIHATSVGWSQRSLGKRIAATETLEVKFAAEGASQITVPRWLKLIEQRILSAPEQPTAWRLQVTIGQPNQPTAEISDLPHSGSLAAFLAARKAYFESIRQGAAELISQAADLSAVSDSAVHYAESYKDLIVDLSSKVQRLSGTEQQRALLGLRTALSIDTIRIVISDHRGHSREAALVGPTHPLRALWHCGWSKLGTEWLERARTAAEEFITPTRQTLLRKLSPINFPSTLALNDGRVFIAIDNLNPFWTLYSPATEEDPRGLFGEVCSSLGVSEGSDSASSLSPDTLVARIKRYLIQHPYVKTLIINAFNPGRAGLLADAIALIQDENAFADLRYDLRLFVPDPETPGVGEALANLVSPDTASATDVFSIPGRSHLISKLTFSVRSTSDFRLSPKDYRGHIGLLFDVFPPQDIGTARPTQDENEAAPLYGLVQPFSTAYRDDETGTAWTRQPKFGSYEGPAASSQLFELLTTVTRRMAEATSSVAQGAPSFESLPTITLELSADQRALIHSIHDACDWVFTVDRNMGIEFFDHGGLKDRPDYLIDFVPTPSPGQGHKLIISSRSLAELEAMIRPLLKQYGLLVSPRHAAVILNQVRALSGRLALKLISSETSRSEVLGLALARLYLQYQGAFRNQIVLPLDSHIELFKVMQKQAEELGDEVKVRRTDLALFDLNLERRSITCNLVEVKCYAQKLGVSGYSSLKESITEQINQSERVLQYHFDPHRTSPDRPDRLLKSQELYSLLKFYLERSVRYQLMDADVATEARALIASLDRGYNLNFSRSALIFDFDKPGTELPEREVGIEFHRIGSNLIRALIEGMDPATSSSGGTDGGGPDGTPQGPSNPLPQVPGLPRLESAAFLVADRPRSHSADALLSDQEPNAAQAKELPSVPHVSSEDATAVPPVAKEPAPVASGVPDTHSHSKQEQALPCDVILGVLDSSPQYGLLGETSGRKVALDLNQTHTISLFGVQGGGKSYTLGSVIEMACMSIPNVSLLRSPLATILFHYSSTLDYKPEFTSMVRPNTEPEQVAALRERYGAEPQSLKDVVVLVPSSKLSERKEEYPDLEVVPIAFSAKELKASHWRFLMGAVGSQSLYLRQVNLLMKKLRGDLTLSAMQHGIEDSGLSDHLKELAQLRLRFAAEYIDDSRNLMSVLRPGRLVIVDLRDEFIEKDEALGLFVVMLQIFAEATYQGKPFNKLVVFDEAHKYIENQDLVTGLVEVVREMRHKGTSILVASQDPPSVPISLIELSSQIILHKFNSPAWLKHIQKANSALNGLTPERLSSLGSGEAYVWSSKATDVSYTHGAIRIKCRPRVTQHGGATKTAI